MKALIIHDSEGRLISILYGDNLRVPVGVPYIYEEIPNNKVLNVPNDNIVVDVSVTPHKLILEDAPISEIDILKEQIKTTQLALAELAETILEG